MTREVFRKHELFYLTARSSHYFEQCISIILAVPSKNKSKSQKAELKGLIRRYDSTLSRHFYHIKIIFLLQKLIFPLSCRSTILQTRSFLRTFLVQLRKQQLRVSTFIIPCSRVRKFATCACVCGGASRRSEIVEETREIHGNTTERPSSKQVCFRINICSIHDGALL